MVQEALFQKTNNITNEPNKTPPLSRAERNIKNYILNAIVKIDIDDKEGSKNNKMSYGHFLKLLREYENILPWINQKTSEYRIKFFEKKCASVTTDHPITASVPTANPVAEYVTSENPVTVFFH